MKTNHNHYVVRIGNRAYATGWSMRNAIDHSPDMAKARKFGDYRDAIRWAQWIGAREVCSVDQHGIAGIVWESTETIPA